MEQEKKSNPNEIIYRMIQCLNDDKINIAYEIAQQHALTIAKSNRYRYSINAIINKRPKKFLPIQSLATNIQKLFDYNEHLPDENVFVPNYLQEIIDELVSEYKNVDALKFHNVPVRNKILLYGNTGNGKTTLAKHIAKINNLPFVEIKSSQVLDSLLGASSKNIENIFTSIKEPCVLFWDEIDSVALTRGSDKMMENDRIVTSLLIYLEKLPTDIIFIAATNRYSDLDSAFSRRFDVKIEIDSPSDNQKQEFALALLNYHNLPQNILHTDLLQYKESYSEVKDLVLELARKYIVSKITN